MPASRGKPGLAPPTPALAPRKHHQSLATYLSSKGARRLLPALVGRKGPVLFISSTSWPALLSDQKKKKITAPCKRSPCRGFLEPLAGPALKEREPHKESRIKSLNSDAFLFIQCDLDMIKLMETQYPLNSGQEPACQNSLKWCDKEMGPVKLGGRLQQRPHSVSPSRSGHC